MSWENLINEWGERYRMASSKDEKAAYWNCSAELLEELEQQGIVVDLQVSQDKEIPSIKNEIAVVVKDLENELWRSLIDGKTVSKYIIRLRQLSK